MIENKCFTKSWIQEKREEIGRVDPTLLEKSIYALALLCGLIRSEVAFVFKGGTSLILLLKAFRRLSIDIDILTETSRAGYESALKQISLTPPFTEYAEDDRGDRGLPKRAHFKFFYKSVFSNRKDYVLLDVLEEKNLYPEIKTIPVSAPFIELTRRVNVRLPSVECLLGDKLTAFAPNTIGVRYNPQASMQIIKQLFDVGELFAAAEDVNTVARAYDAISAVEIGYRGNAYTREQALDDTFETSVKLCGIGLRGMSADKESAILQDGIKKIDSHLVNVAFRLEDAKIAASRAALLAAILRRGAKNKKLSDLRWKSENVSSLVPLLLAEPLERLGRIKATIPEAFYNLYTAQVLLR
ncbi:MAG: nucleotidyl transferase AbiEii/AbiGii toxin family protein [Candidatus Omnitrophica bacterium]|nr:nucleotidyl transferase AbiEii/AbiGii toxin family protein [Candidatus Omnitrophota bacterium]MBU4479537.1 nucleotidyl transferase AbiEii/AbiGii toxin family protein [Candidatus Omnitrophota bacterium]